MRFSITLALIILVKVSYGQDYLTEVEDENEKNFVFSAGLSYQKQLVGELGFIYGYSSVAGPCSGLNIFGLKVASEFSLNSDSFFIAPKIGIQLDYAIIGVRLNVIDYTDFTYHDIKLTPEIGLTFFGLVDIFYGYNHSLTENRIENIGTNRVTLTVNLSRNLWNF